MYTDGLSTLAGHRQNHRAHRVADHSDWTEAAGDGAEAGGVNGGTGAAWRRR